ncbi:thioredoxin domain-containing protein 11 [Eurytemora carolleeae]|uniref:thioredoxin domain-containing protein 11 n=1 Tax=Eurytemora carolleeae TaxID=1294199 RepID=UPI000C76B017|nr:thioredoxin domain-containing protein 11 [Eurytemora carolleeae]|eukprot:XP_023329964.1 thioredoxin domain-containing protein 11-like [Eurytemora affinis]
MQLHTSHPTKLYNHNSTHTYPNKTIDSEKLASWALKRTVVPASWLNLPSRKSHVLKRVLEGGSGNVLLLFGPRIKLGKDSLYKLLRQVAIEYQNCDETKSSDSLVDRLKQPGQTDSCKDSFKLSSSSSSFCQLRSWSYDSLEDAFPACTLPSSASNSTTCLNRFRMRSSLQGYDPHVQLMLEENASEKRKVKMLVEEMHIGGLMEDGEEALDVFGLGCRSNKTLRMYRVDSSSSLSLLNSLGLEGQSLPFPVILNLAEESLHLPSANFRMQHAEEDLKRFLVSWHTGELAGKPGFRSTDHGSNVRFEPNSETDNSDTVSVITELSASKFSSDIIPHKDVVLFYTSSFCTFCSAAAYAFHTVKMYLDSVPTIRFLMIDATKNDLSWEFTALSYPSVIFFPRNRHDMSRVYPTEENLNVINLLSFVVWNLTPSDRLQLALNHCDYTCRQQVRLAASLRVNQLSSELRRNGSKVPLNSKLQISRRLKYAKSVLYVLSTLENATVQPQMHNRYFTAIMERMLSGNP